MPEYIWERIAEAMDVASNLFPFLVIIFCLIFIAAALIIIKVVKEIRKSRKEKDDIFEATRKTIEEKRSRYFPDNQCPKE